MTSTGFSHAIDPHRPPFWNAEQGRADTWSFAVIGECFNANGHHTVEVTGWLSHEVHHYEEQSSHYLGAQSLGSYLAEREALTWAGLWRLSQNTTTCTLFRTDSMICTQQAVGASGCNEDGISFQAFRGVCP